MQDLAKVKYESLQSKFFKKDLTVAICSGICYGTYSAFLTLGMARGVWADWFGPNTAALSAFVLTYVLGALGSAVNDTVGGIWCLIEAAAQGKLGDVARCVKTKPGVVMMLCGIIICFLASAIIGGTSFSAVDSKVALGCLIGFISALGWGIEGCVAGFGTTMIDNKIGVTIRQCTSGLTNMIILIPVLCMIAGNIRLAPQLLKQAYTTPAMIFFVVSGLFCELSYSLWYKGNAMCGAALGMTCNGAFAFWGPFFCWILMGVICKESGWMLSPIQWIAAIIMFIGIFLIAMNPLDLLKRKES